MSASVSPDMYHKVLEHVQCSHAALDTAQAELTKQAAVCQRCQELIPAVVDSLMKHCRIDPDSRDKAAAMLREPDKVLEILIRTADPQNTIQPPALGRPTTKTGSAEPSRSAADIAYEQILMGNR